MKKFVSILLCLLLITAVPEVFAKNKEEINTKPAKTKLQAEIEKQEGFTMKEKLVITSAVLFNVGLVIGLVFICMNAGKD